jgi:hypothetical protein
MFVRDHFSSTGAMFVTRSLLRTQLMPVLSSDRDFCGWHTNLAYDRRHFNQELALFTNDEIQRNQDGLELLVGRPINGFSPRSQGI